MIIGEQYFNKEFILRNLMGPNSIRIVDELTSGIKLNKGMRVLDLGCGTGLTSFYMAKKFDVTVYAADLWINPSDNYKRAVELGIQSNIIPLHIDANNLPFADGFFDVIVSVGAFQCFATTDDYLDQKLLKLLKVDGKLLVAIPGLKNEFEDNLPNKMKVFGFDQMNHHSCQWWSNLWGKSKCLTDISSHEMLCFDDAWAEWLATDDRHAIEDQKMLEVNNGKYMAIVSLRASKLEV